MRSKPAIHEERTVTLAPRGAAASKATRCAAFGCLAAPAPQPTTPPRLSIPARKSRGRIGHPPSRCTGSRLPRPGMRGNGVASRWRVNFHRPFFAARNTICTKLALESHQESQIPPGKAVHKAIECRSSHGSSDRSLSPRSPRGIRPVLRQDS
jgi:hypothetical protein